MAEIDPRLFERLSAPNGRVRSRALQDLRLQLLDSSHGRFLDVALEAIPRLAEHLAREEVTAGVLELLGDIAAGNHRVHLGRGLPSLDVEGIGPARETQAAIEALADRFLEHVDSSAPPIRAAAAFALAWLPRVAERSRPRLLARLAAEKNAVARASMLLALGYLGAPVDQLRGHREPSAAIARMLVDPANLADELDTIYAPSAKPMMKGLPFNGGALLQLSTFVLREATVRRGDLERHRALVERVPPAIRPLAESWTILVAARAPALTPRDPLDPGDLPEPAREALRELAAKLRSRTNPHLYEAFYRAGLFAYADSNERALGIDPPGPLDARAGGRPLWWWLHRARSQRMELAAWLDHLRGTDALAVLEDAADAPYELYRDRFRTSHYDVEPLIAIIEQSARELGVTSVRLDERLATLREYAANPHVQHGKGPIAWP